MKQWQSMRMLPWLLLLPALSLQAQTQPRVEGTLFTSAEQRRYLDYLREDFLLRNAQDGFDIEDSQIPDIPGDGTTGPAGPTEYTLDGVLRRGDGRISVWLNNQLVSEDALPANARLIRDGATYAIQFSTASGPQLLRPGQTLQVANGAVQERYQRVVVASPDDSNATADAATTTNAAESASATTAPASATTSADQAVSVATNEPIATTTPAVTDNTDADQVVDSLPAEVRSNPALLDSMIESLQTLRQQAGTDDDDSE